MKVVFALLVFFFLRTSIFAEIIETAVIDPIIKACDDAYRDLEADDILVVFDVDDVLIAPKDEILKDKNKDHLKDIQRAMNIWGRWESDQQQKIFSTIWLNRENEVVDQSLVTHIQNLQSRGIKVVALTNCFTGEFGAIPSMEKWRSDELKQHGYRFADSWPNISFYTFMQFPQESKGAMRVPTFFEGIIFTCRADKGDILEAFLKHINAHPKKIIFIDDKIKNVESVETFARRAGIAFIGFKYTAIKNRPKVPFNKKRADLQFAILEKEGVWVSDTDANIHLKPTL